MSQEGKIATQLQKLASKEGLSLGILFSASRPDFDLLATSAALCLPKEEKISEKAVNDCLKQWLQASGRMLHVDHVELRRWLADLGLVRRDSAGTEYWPSIEAEPYRSLAAALNHIDVAQLVQDTIDRERAQRAARKAAWQMKASS